MYLSCHVPQSPTLGGYTHTHAHGFWVGMGVICSWWAWVRYLSLWVDMAAILMGMGGHGLDIIVHGWVWAKSKHIGRGHWMSSHSMLARVRAPNYLHPLRWVHPSLCLLPGRLWVGSWMYKVIDLEKNEIIGAVSLALPMNRDTTAKFNTLLWWKLKGAPTFPIMSCVARSVLCIPASNFKSESNFSDARNTLTKKHSGLKPTIVNDILFVWSNQDLV